MDISCVMNAIEPFLLSCVQCRVSVYNIYILAVCLVSTGGQFFANAGEKKNRTIAFLLSCRWEGRYD